MNDFVSPVRIEPDGIYDDGVLVLSLGLTHRTLQRARRSGKLRHTRSGRRILYRGQWVLDWLDSTAAEKEKGVQHDA
ncbi:MAG TPA: helix-turn-helix domain-containing protein [Candidatus Anammoximicrobium sp.]|nr:helix-turn-helix domain-containing protein [Candidatus Anammoximicrobium sp.]